MRGYYPHMKKAYIALGVLLVVAVGYKLLNPASEQENRPLSNVEEPVARTWKGNLTKLYNTDFNRRGVSMTVDRIVFSRANRARVNVMVDLSVVTPRKPKWLNSASFEGVRIESAKTFKPKVSSSRAGGTWRARLTFKGIPVRAVGSTCSVPMVDPLFLRTVKVPGADLMIVLDAPPPPPGHCLGKGYKKPKPVVTVGRVRVSGKKVVVYGSVKHANFKRVKVQVRGRVRTVATPKTRKDRFKAVFRLKKGKYQVRAGYGKKWTSARQFKVR